jgi:hypothetical protein
VALPDATSERGVLAVVMVANKEQRIDIDRHARSPSGRRPYAIPSPGLSLLDRTDERVAGEEQGRCIRLP